MEKREVIKLLPRFTQTSAFGAKGERPTILVLSPEVAKDAVTTNKIYTHTAEMELKFPVDYEIKKPTQHLYTRVGNEKYRVDILLDKPLTLRQRMKLKSLAVIEDLKTPFKPSLLVNKNHPRAARLQGIENLDDVNEITRILRDSGNHTVVRAFETAARYALRYQSTAIGRGSVTYRDPHGNIVTDRIELRTVGASARSTRTPPRSSSQLRSLSIRYDERTPRINETDRAIRTREEARETQRVTDSERRATPERVSREEMTLVDTSRVERGEERRPPDDSRRPPEERTDRPPEERTERPSDDGRQTPPPDEIVKGPPGETKPDRDVRSRIKANKGALAWCMGKLGDKDRWDVILYPYQDESDHVILVGQEPAGATIMRGPKSAFKTASVLHGKKPSGSLSIFKGLGAMSLSISPTGGKKLSLDFSPLSEKSRLSKVSRINGNRSFPLR